MARRTMVVDLYDDDGEVDYVEVPSRFEVCPRCEGSGRHVDERADNCGQGYTSSEWREMGQEFQCDYIRGHYDVTCSTCNGLRVVQVVDRDNCDTEVLRRLDEQERELAELRAEEAAERRRGC